MTGTGTLADPIVLETLSGTLGLPWSSAPTDVSEGGLEQTYGRTDTVLPCWWFRIDPALGGTVLNLWTELAGDFSDTWIDVWTGTPGAMVRVAENDDFEGVASRLLNLALSEPVLIRIAPYYYYPDDPAASPGDEDLMAWDLGTADWYYLPLQTRWPTYARGEKLFYAAPPPVASKAASWQLNNVAYSGYTSRPPFYLDGDGGLEMGWMGQTYQQSNAVLKEQVDIRSGLTVEVEVEEYNSHGKSIFFLNPAHNSPVHTPAYANNPQQAGFMFGAAGLAIIDSSYNNYIWAYDAQTPTAYNSWPPSRYNYGGASPRYLSYTKTVLKVEIIPTATKGQYQARYSKNGTVLFTTPAIVMPDKVYPGFGFAQHYSYMALTRWRNVRITAGTPPRLSSTWPRMDIAVSSGLEKAEPSVIAPVTLMGVGTEMVAPGRQVTEMVSSGAGAPSIGVQLRGTYELTNPEFDPEVYERISPRGVQGVSLEIPTPAVAYGKPFVPEIWAKPDSSTSADRSKFQVIADPPPPTPPPSIVSWRWTAPMAVEAENDWIEDWPATSSSGPHWKSLFPYRPRHRPYVQQGRNGRTHRYPYGVIHDPNYVEHLWIDMGQRISQPYTWIICSIITAWHAPMHQLLDTGAALPRSTIAAVRKDRNISEGFPERAQMVAEKSIMTVTTNPVRNRGNRVVAKHHTAIRPRVFFGVFNGANSFAGVWDNRHKSIVKGKVEPGPARPRYFITGRQHGRISDQQAAKMVTLEIRFVGKALTLEEMAAHYSQLSTAYNFQIN